MVPLMEAFQRQLPNASITVVEDLSVALSERLSLGRIEIALLFNQRSSPNLTIETLCSEELVLVGGNSRAALPKLVKFAEIRKFPLILPAMPNTIRTSVESACRQAQIQPDIVIEVDTVQSILDLVRKGMGYTIVPRGTVPHDLRQSGYRVCRIGSPRLTHTVSLATSRGHPLTRLGIKTCQVIRELNLPKLLRS
jgi:LysR family nitrogen assimilation transcriptional regulator